MSQRRSLKQVPELTSFYSPRKKNPFRLHLVFTHLSYGGVWIFKLQEEGNTRGQSLSSTSSWYMQNKQMQGNSTEHLRFNTDITISPADKLHYHQLTIKANEQRAVFQHLNDLSGTTSTHTPGISRNSGIQAHQDKSRGASGSSKK